MKTDRTSLKWMIPAIAMMLSAIAAGEVNMQHIQNRWLRVAFDQSRAALVFSSEPAGREFAQFTCPNPSGCSAVIAPVYDRVLGDGQAIELPYAHGRTDRFLLFSDVPFVLIRSTLCNTGGEPRVINHVPGVSLTLNLDTTPDALRAFGTAGLTRVDQHTGSYAYLAVVNPQTRAGVVSGWITHNRGSGLVFSSIKDKSAHMDARLDYGRLRIQPGKSEETETFAVGRFEDARLGLEAWADAIAKIYSIHLPPQPSGYCTWYSDQHGRASDEVHIKELANFAARQLAPFGFQVVQIDDCWQLGKRRNGPGKNFTAHDPAGPYSGGMKAAATSISEDGLRPGIWLMPFAGDHLDPFFEPHQNWFVRRADGKPYETEWGGTCMDMTMPEAREHLRDVIHRVVHEWGYTYLKLDGLWTGLAAKQVYVNNGYVEDGLGDAIFHDPGKTNIEAFRDGLKLVRQAAGPDVFMLGCCVPQNMRSLGASFGLVNAMRIGPDNGAKWPDLKQGPIYGSRRYFLHGRVWYNDPDPVYVRAAMTLSQARLICSWVTISGQLNLNSDWLPGLPLKRLDILKRTMPPHGLRPRPVDLFEHDPPRIWLLTDESHEPRRDVVAVYNWDDKPAEIECALNRIGLRPGVAYVGFDYWDNSFIAPMRDELTVSVPAQSCRILALRPVADHPQVISTSRHITQGIVDLLEETWNGNSSELHGQSRLVGGDPYELRVVVRSSNSVWRIEKSELSEADRIAGVTISTAIDGPIVRVVLQSPVSRNVAWTLQCRQDEAIKN